MIQLHPFGQLLSSLLLTLLVSAPAIGAKGTVPFPDADRARFRECSRNTEYVI